MKIVYIFLLAAFGFIMNGSAQTITQIRDSSGEEILIHEDSCFFSRLLNGLMFYGEGKESGLRNFYFSNGDTTIALLVNGFPLSAPISKPIERLYGEEFVFRAGDIWYKTKGSRGTTTVFYNNSLESNPYQYEIIYPSTKGDLEGPHLLIVAIEKSTLDTITLFHNLNTGSTSPFQQRIRIFDGPFYGTGQFIGNYFIASIYDEVVGAWNPVSIYRVHGTTWKSLLPLESRPFYRGARVTFKSWELITLENLDGSLDAFQYRSNEDDFVPFTFFTNQGLKLFEISNVKTTGFGLPNVLPIAYNAYYYAVRSGNGPLRYFYVGSIEDVEIKGLENSIGADFMNRPVNEDTIHYYDYSMQDAGLVRFNKVDKSYTMDESNVDFSPSYQLKGYLRKMYFGSYSEANNQIEALYKDFETDRYHVIESELGERVSNPINFEFYNDKVFIYSRQEDGLKLYVFDPDATTSTDKEPESDPQFAIYPNPASDRLEISIGERLLHPSDLKFRIIDGRGVEVKGDNLNGSNSIVDVKDLFPGMYYMQILDNTRLIQTTSISINR